MEIQNSYANNVILTQSELEASYKLRNKEIFDYITPNLAQPSKAVIHKNRESYKSFPTMCVLQI